MENNKKDQPSDAKLAWQAPKIVHLASDQTQGKTNNLPFEYTDIVTGRSYAPS